MEIGFYSGSFDPFTIGHLHVLKQALRVCDKVIVGIGTNSDKKRRFDKDIMKEAIEKVLVRENISNVTVITYEGLTFKAALDNNATLLLRGIRNNGTDYPYEESLAANNKEYSGLDTIYIRACEYGTVSSSGVMELLTYGMDVSKYLPKDVLDAVMKSKV